MSSPRPPAAFTHHAALYRDDEEFLEMAVPFVKDGLAWDEPVLVAVTAANLELLRGALDGDPSGVDLAETRTLGARFPQRIAAFHRYYQQHARDPARQVRILVEPVWGEDAGRETGEALARLESALNEILSTDRIWMICPYDARVMGSQVLAEARRTHPAVVRGRSIRPSTRYVDPVRFARSRQDPPLPAPPAGAAALRFTHAGELARVRRFVTAQAVAHGLTQERGWYLMIAVGEAASYLVEQGTGGVTLRMWAAAGRLACDLAGRARVTDPFLGLRPPTLEPRPGDGLWLTRHLCDTVEVRSTAAGCTIRLEVPAPRAQERHQPDLA